MEKISSDLLTDDREIKRIFEIYAVCGVDEYAVYERLMAGEKKTKN